MECTYPEGVTLSATDAIFSGTYGLSIIKVDSETVATTPTNRARTTIGVGEEVVCTVQPSLSVTWSNTAGSISATTGNSTTFTAPDRATNATVIAIYSGHECEVEFTVIEPSGGHVVQQPGSGIRHTTNTWSVGFLGDLYIEPSTVSFYNIEFREGETNATATGSLAHWNNLVHPSWTAGVTQSNQVDILRDHIYSGQVGPPPPTTVGDFLWPLPWEFRVGTGGWKQFATINHHATCDTNGVATIEKGGAGPFSRAPSDPTSSW